MFVSNKSRNWHYLFWTVQICILVLAIASRKPILWSLACALNACISLIAWYYSVQWARAITEIPKSTIAAAAQGYVKLTGTISTKPEYLIVATGGLRCVWFRCVIYRQSTNGKEEIQRILSDSIFELIDDSGETCMINPEGAEIFTSDYRSWYSDDYRYELELLFPGQPLFVIGEFSSLGANQGLQEFNTDVSLLLAEWKKDRPALLKRFDKNCDGQIDLEEWEAVRQEAYRQINRQNRIIEHQPDIHIIKQPGNGSPFVISDIPEKKLRFRSLIWAWVHLLVFFASLYGVF